MVTLLLPWGNTRAGSTEHFRATLCWALQSKGSCPLQVPGTGWQQQKGQDVDKSQWKV